MDPSSLAQLEFDKLLEGVSSFAQSPMGRDRVLSLIPSRDRQEARGRLSQTEREVENLLDGLRILRAQLLDRERALRAEREAVIRQGERAGMKANRDAERRGTEFESQLKAWERPYDHAVQTFLNDESRTASTPRRRANRPNEKGPCYNRPFEAEWREGMKHREEKLRVPRRRF
ncbi:MAG TPA: hypothetical protein VMN76_03850 [Acidobacteriota bacterium]|nr:hypothetical protein [Acidobacteriota bacterium]